jgi:serine protease Do
LNLFEFDYDLTFAVFFLDADEKVYARYGGRDATDPDSRQSLAGLAATMRSVLEMHRREEKEFAPKTPGGPKTVRDLTGSTRTRGCMHCHQVKEGINAALTRAGRWERDMVWRYPLSENVGLTLDVDKANVVASVKPDSPASRAGLAAGDVVRRLGGVPIHSSADIQYALDRAPKAGPVEIVWRRGGEQKTASLKPADGWRKTDISWRPSLRHLIPSARLYGTDLTAAEKAALGLPAKRLAFRHREAVHRQAKAAGVLAGDIILGLDGKALDLDQEGFMTHVERTYLIGDRVTVDLIRDGKRQSVPMTLAK